MARARGGNRGLTVREGGFVYFFGRADTQYSPKTDSSRPRPVTGLSLDGHHRKGQILPSSVVKNHSDCPLHSTHSFNWRFLLVQSINPNSKKMYNFLKFKTTPSPHPTSTVPLLVWQYLAKLSHPTFWNGLWMPILQRGGTTPVQEGPVKVLAFVSSS